MELRQLEYLVAVAEEANFTRAAARLHVAQPGVSAQIRQLERELGIELLDRSGRTVRPTEAGAAVLALARSALEASAGVRSVVDGFRGLLRGTVRMGMVVACGAVTVPQALATFHRAHPDVQLALSEANSDLLVDRVRSGELDVAVVGTAGPLGEGIVRQTLLVEPLVAVVAPTHPLAVRASITLRALAEWPVIAMPAGTGLRAGLDGAAAQAGVRLHVAFEAANANMLLELAATGLGVGVVASSMAAAEQHRLHSLPLVRPSVRTSLALVWRDSNSRAPAASALVDHLRSELRAGGSDAV